jgi:hypothetical protein
MQYGFDHLAQYEQQFRERVVYPRAARRAQQAYELALMQRSGGGAVRRRTPVHWIGRGLIGLGDLLTATGGHLAPRTTEFLAPDT